MADFLLTVGIDTKLSFSQMQTDITNLASQLSSNPIKIKAEFDKASLANMKSQIDALTNMTGKTKDVNVGVKGTAGVAADMDNIAKSADKAATATNKMNAAVSKTTILSQGTTQYYNSLRQVNTLLEQVTKNQTKWTAAQHGKSSGAYKDLSMYADELRNLQQQLQTGQMTAEQFNKSMASIKTGVASASGAIRTAGEATKSWSQRIGGLGSKFATWFGTTQIIMAGVRAVKDMVNNVAEIDSAMIELRKVTDETDETYNAFLDRATKKSQEMGVSIKDTVKATADFARLGNSISDSEILSDAAIVYKNVGDIDNIEDASQSIISTMQAFGVLPKDVMSIVDKFNEVGNKYAISSEGIGEALLRSSSAMKSAGNTLDETIALTTAANTIVQNPESVGTTLKTVSMYLRAAKTEAEEAGESTDGMAASVSELREELMALTGGQVDIQSDNNTFKSTYQILKELSGVWNSLTDISKANILEMVGGKRNANVVAALLENFSIAEEALQTSLNSEGSAMKEYEKWLDSVEAKQLQLKASWEGLSQDFLSADFVKFGVDALREIVNVIDGVVNAIGSLGTVLTGGALVGLKKFISAKGLGGLSTILGAIPTPALVAAGAIAAVGVAIHAVNKANYNKKYNWSEGLVEQAEKAKEAANEFASIAKLQDEVSELKLVINSDDSSTEDLIAAKNRLQEISTYLKEQYGLEIDADVSKLDEALAKLKEIAYLEAQGSRSTLNNDLSGKKDSYEKSKKEVDALKKNYETSAEKSKNYNLASSAIEDLDDKFDDRASNVENFEKWVDSVNEVLDLYEIPETEVPRLSKKLNANNAYPLMELESLRKKYNKDSDPEGKDNAYSKYKDTSNSIEEFEKSRNEFVDSALVELEFGNQEEAVKLLTAAVKDYGASVEDTAIKASKAEIGIKNLSEIAGDSEKIQRAVTNYQKYATQFGATSEQISIGSALISNGFESVSAVVSSGDKAISSVLTDIKRFGEQSGLFDGLDSAGIANKLTEIAQSVNLLPDTKHIEIDAKGNVTVIDDVKAKIDALNANKQIKLSVDADGNIQVLDTVDEKLKKFADSGMVNIKFNVDTGNFDIADLTGNKLGEITAEGTVIWKSDESNVEKPEDTTADGTINYTVGDTPDTVPSANSTANFGLGTSPTTVPDASGTANYSGAFPTEAPTLFGTIIYRIKKLFGADVDGTAHAYGTAHASGTAFANGNARHGNWGKKDSGIALGGELGEELVVRNGKFFTIGSDSAEFFTYRKDDIIFNAEQTKQIFEKGRITHGKRRGRALATGTAFATGTNNLFSATHTLDASAQVVVRDVSVDAAKLDEALEDTLKEMQEGIDGAIGAYEQDIFIAEKHNASSEEIIAIYKKMQQKVHDQANRYREKGLGDDSEYIQKMQKQWWDYQENINEVIADGYENNREQIENAAELAKIQLEKAVASGDYGAVSTYTSNIIDYYKQMQESVHDQAEYYRSLGYDDTSEEVSELSQLWWDYQENINEVIADGYDALVERAIDTVDTIQNVYDTLKSAADEYAETGKLPIDLLKSMSEIGIEYMTYLQDENGMLEINEDKINAVVAARTRQLAVDTALSYVEKLRLALADGNLGKVESLVSATESASNATWELVYANLAMLDLNDEQYSKALANVNKFRSLADSAAMSVFDDSNKERSTMLDNTKDALDTILDLTMELVEYEVNQEIEAIERRIESYQEIIDLKKEALETTKEENDYEDEVADKVKEIADIQARINALSLDDSREAQAERIALEEEMAELQGDLADYQADYGIEKQQEMLDKMAEDYTEAREDDIADLEDSISSQEKIYELAIKRIKNDWDGLYDDIITWNYEAGSNIESEIVDAWELATAAVQEYGSWVKAVKAMENIDTEDNTELGESGSYIDPRAIRNQMRANSLAWYTASDPEQRNLESKNKDYASQLGLTTSDGVWYMPNSDEPFYTIGTWEAVDYIVKAMRTNSSNWTEGRTDLEKANEKMARYIQDLTGQTVRKDGDGVWWIGDDVLYDSYGKFHTGGIIGKSTLKQDEVMAILQKGEAVLDEKREEGLYKIVDFTQVLSERFGKSINTAGLNNLLNSFSLIPATKDLMPITQGGIGAVEFKPNIEVNITHGGSMSESDAKRYGAIAAETTLNELKSAFTKKGITNIGSSALK